MFSSVLLSHGVQILRMIRFLCFREQNIFLYSWRMWKNVVFDKSYSCSAVGVMKSTARECNSIQESSIPLCLECWQTLASSLKANYNETSRDLQCYWYLSAWLYFQRVVLMNIHISNSFYAFACEMSLAFQQDETHGLKPLSLQVSFAIVESKSHVCILYIKQLFVALNKRNFSFTALFK